MIMVIGGAFQGKWAYAKEHFWVEGSWIDGENCAYEEIFSCAAIRNFHRFVYRFLGNKDLDDLPQRLFEENPDIILVSDELGCGVVPIEERDRHFREKTGRLCIVLAADAREVHRVICGIGMVIKHA